MATNVDDASGYYLNFRRKTLFFGLARVLVHSPVEEAVLQRSEDTMKIRILILTAVMAAGLLAPASASARGGFAGEISFGVFYESLGPFGEWITVDDGVYAWRPWNVAEGWRPYWNGRWMWTADGWYWDSDEPWAWATYHYGRWYYDDYYGWIWTPGYDWAPAWVEWRYGGDHVGWAPLGPYAVFNIHFGISYAHHWVTPYHYWSFIDCRHIMHHHVHQYIYRTDHNTRFIGRTRTAGSVWYDNGRIRSRGPETGYIERRGDIRIPRTELVEVERNDQMQAARRGERDRIGVYRPRVQERNEGGRIERPDNVRERERMPSLDTRQMDVRRREVARESGRDVNRTQSGTARSGEQRSADRNSRWHEVTPPGGSQDVGQPANPNTRNRREMDGQGIDRRAGKPTDRTGGVSRSQESRPAERSNRPNSRIPSEGRPSGNSNDRPAMRQQYEGRSQGSQADRPAVRQQYQGRSSGSSVGSSSSRSQSEGRSGGRSESRSADRPSSRGRQR